LFLYGVYSLIFTGGIGERSSEVRAAICNRLTYLGINIYSRSNDTHNRLISHPKATCSVHVVPTDEEQLIAQRTVEALPDRLSTS